MSKPLPSDLGSAVIEFALVLPVLLLFAFATFNSSIVIALRPGLEGSMLGVLQQLQGSVYTSDAGRVIVNRPLVQSAIEAILRPEGGRPSAATAQLSATGKSHQISIAALECGCSGNCTQVAGHVLESDLATSTASWPATIKAMCESKMLERSRDSRFSSELDCASGSLDSRVCFAMMVRIPIGLSNQELLVASVPTGLH